MFHCWRQATTKSRGAQNIPGENKEKKVKLQIKMIPKYLLQSLTGYKNGRNPQAREIRKVFLRTFELFLFLSNMHALTSTKRKKGKTKKKKIA